MKLVSLEDWQNRFNKEQLKGILPHFFYPEYLAFERNQGFIPYLIYDDALDMICPMVVSGNRWLKSGRFLYKPMLATGGMADALKLQRYINTLPSWIHSLQLCHRIIDPLHFFVFENAPENSNFVPFSVYYIDLEAEVDTIFGRFSNNYRNEIRKAQKENVQIKSGRDQLDAFYTLNKETLNREGQFVHPRSYFEQQPTDCTSFYVAYEGQKPVSASFIYFSHHSAYYFYGGTALDIKNKNAGKLLQWEIIKSLMQMGCKKYYLGGARKNIVQNSKFQYLQQYKKRFGAIEDKGFIWTVDYSPLRSKCYEKLIQLKSIITRKAYNQSTVQSEKAAEI